MKCPLDNTDLQMSERQGIEIDYCPQCRGVWLDRGELDKLIERSASVAPVSAPTHSVHTQQPEYRHEESKQYTPHGKKRRESFLGDLFDF